MESKKIMIKGVEYTSLKEAATALGVHYGNFVRRYRSGWSMEQCLGKHPPPRRDAPNRTPIVSRLGAFDSIRKASVATGIQEKTISRRLRLGWSGDQALDLEKPPTRGARGTTVKCESKDFPSYAALARAYKVNALRTSKRIRSGWTPEEAVGIEPPPPRFRDHDGAPRNHLWKNRTVVNGQQTIVSAEDTYRLYCITNKVNKKEYIGATTNTIAARWRGHKRQAKLGRKSKFYNAIRKYGVENFQITEIHSDARDWSELQDKEIAMIRSRNTIKNGYNTAMGGSIGTSKAIEVSGLKFGSRQAAAIHFGVDVGVFNLRIARLGWSPEEAAGLKKRPFQKIKIKDSKGRTFNSLNEAAEYYSLSYKLVHDRYRAKGWTIDQALGLEPPPRVPRKQLIIAGKIYESISQAARAFSIKPDTLSARLRKGMTPDEAVKKKSKNAD